MLVAEKVLLLLVISLTEYMHWRGSEIRGLAKDIVKQVQTVVCPKNHAYDSYWQWGNDITVTS